VRLAVPDRNSEPAPPAPAPRNTAPLKRPDVFDPSRNPGAPGAPRQLGSIHNQRSLPLRNDPRHGTALPRGPLPGAGAERGLPGPDTPLNLSRKDGALPGATPGATSGATPGGAPGIRSASLPAPDASPRQTYRTAVAALRNRHYVDAEKGFKSFLERFPNSTLTPSVRYNLGIVYASRSRHREAAEQFLTVSTKHGKSARAPNSLYRLGLSLERLGASEQACASYAEVERRYPQSPKSLRARVERQMKKAKC